LAWESLILLTVCSIYSAQFIDSSAKAGHVAAKLQLQQCKLLTPFKGMFVEVLGNIGEQCPGNPVAEIVDLSRLKIRVDIPLKLSHNIKPGIRTDILSGEYHCGKS